jgi:succinate dehydrogenase flavoprotein subunit
MTDPIEHPIEHPTANTAADPTATPAPTGSTAARPGEPTTASTTAPTTAPTTGSTTGSTTEPGADLAAAVADEDIEVHDFDVIVIGAGGAGLRAAIEARLHGKRVAIISKSLFGKAHTVMAEGGCAASMGNVNPNDNWMVHYRDTMRGGKFLNNWRMAELHAKEAPDRVWELETYGALFDRTKDGKISQRNFGGHTYPRLAHVGDRTGLEMIRTLQQKIVSLQQDDFKAAGDYESHIRVFHETTVTELFKADGRIAGAIAYYRSTGKFVRFNAPAIVLATGGVGKSYQVTSNSWEYTGDGHALALRAGATLINMEFLQFHPTGMVWPPSVKGILVTESVRGDGGVLRNSEGKRFMFDYIPDVFKEQYATSEDEGDRWYSDADNNRRPPELLPRDEVARAINSEVKAGRGSPHGGVFLDIASRLTPEEIQKRLPSMYHQFKELADVDITKEPMEVGPTCHYVMGGVEVDPDTTMSIVPGLFAAGEVAGGMHGSNRLGGNSLSDLLVFGRRAGLGAASYVDALGGVRPAVAESDLEDAVKRALLPFSSATDGGENPFVVQLELQKTMHNLVGIIRKADEMEQALKALQDLAVRTRTVSVEGHREFNPGWHLALDLRNMLLVSLCVAKAALERQESRGGHTRDDYPAMDSDWRHVLLVLSALGEDNVDLVRQEQIAMRPELLDLFELDELKKYYTGEEIGGHRADQGMDRDGAHAGTPGQEGKA